MRKGAQLLELFDALASAGLEIGSRFVRVPLEKQLEQLLVERAASGKSPLVALRRIEKNLDGASSREARETVAHFVERGRAKLVVRDSEAFIAPPAIRILDPRAMERLAEIANTLLRATRAAARHDASLLTEDVERLLSPFASPKASDVRRAAGQSLQSVEALVDKHREASGLTSVPKLIRILGGASARAQIHATLLEGARSGRFELRPESGMGRLSQEDAALCIPGPQGSRLSWVRRIEEPS